jgi:acetolactate synthase-1/2/3 large subunit
VNAAWEIVARELAEAGVAVVVGLAPDEPGLLDAAGEEPRLRAVPVRDQRGAGALACGYSMTARRPVVMALSSGPDFSSAVPGLVEAASLCVPLVVVTVRIPAEAIGRGGFQELDQAGMLGELVKWRHLAPSADQLAWATRQAVRQAVGRGGLALLEISAEALAEQPGSDAGNAHRERDPIERPRALPPAGELERAAALLDAARRPLILAGGGSSAAAAGFEIQALAEQLGAAVFTTATGRGAFDEEHPLACGLTGLYATPPMEQVAAEADVVLALGTRLEETMRLGWPELTRVRLIHVDLDVSAFGSWAEPAIALLGDTALTALELVLRLGPAEAGGEWRAGWRRRIESAREAAMAMYGRASFEASPARAAIGAIGEAFPDAIVVQENGLNDIWGYHWPVLRVGAEMSVITPGEQTMLGFGLPAAIGAKLAADQRPVVAICGDGALGMSLTALPAAADLGCGLVLVVFDNRGFGWPRFLREGGNGELTRFETTWDWSELVESVGGWWAQPSDDASLRAALGDAREIAALGRIAAIVVPVPDGDIPVGVQRFYGGVEASV